MNFQKMPAKKDFCSQLLPQSWTDYPPPIWSLSSTNLIIGLHLICWISFHISHHICSKCQCSEPQYHVLQYIWFRFLHALLLRSELSQFGAFQIRFCACITRQCHLCSCLTIEISRETYLPAFLNIVNTENYERGELPFTMAERMDGEGACNLFGSGFSTHFLLVVNRPIWHHPEEIKFCALQSHLYRHDVHHSWLVIYFIEKHNFCCFCRQKRTWRITHNLQNKFTHKHENKEIGFSVGKKASFIVDLYFP